MRILSIVSLLPFVAACSIATPFKSQNLDALGDTDTVVIGLTHAVIRDDSQARDQFFRQTENVEASLQGRQGFLGLSKRVKILGQDAWTMTAWRDEASLEAFVRSPAHQQAIREGFSSLQSARFARLTVNASELPLDWGRAFEALEASGRGY